MYKALYRAYRPEIFDEVLGQEHVVKILKNQIMKNSVGHAYLFCGTRGTGKTTVARLLAKGVNCLEESKKPCGICKNCKSIKEGTFVDVIEIDAASNNGVENIRELNESVKYPPVVGEKKVYIIDEVHMLSVGAFNALLKTLEEPPENVMFILATTEPQKLPATILSRCLKLDFRRVSQKKIQGGMSKICKELRIEVDEEALAIISENADGSVRDGLSLLDQCISTGSEHITCEEILEVLGIAGEDIFGEITDYINSKNSIEALILLDKIIDEGKDIRQFIKDWIFYYRNLMISKFIREPNEIMNMSDERFKKIKNQAEMMELRDIKTNIGLLSKTSSDAKWLSQPRVILEVCILKMAGQMHEEAVYLKNEVKEQVENDKLIINNAKTEKKNEKKDKLSKESNNIADKNDLSNDFDDKIDVEKIWTKTLSNPQLKSASFELVKKGTQALRIVGSDFIIQCTNEVIVKYIDRKKAKIEEIISSIISSNIQIKCIIGEDEIIKNKNNNNNLKETVENVLGIDVEII